MPFDFQQLANFRLARGSHKNTANGPTETIGMLACWAADAIKDYVRSPDSLI